MNQRKCRMFSVLNEEQPASWPHLPLRPLLAVRLAWDVSIKIAERNCLETLPYINRSVLKKRAACIDTMQNKWGLGTAQQAFWIWIWKIWFKNRELVPARPACWYNVIDETKIVSSKTVIWLCRFPKHSNIEVLTGAESGKTACLVSIQELLTA